MLPLADAAACRSEADWLIGINGTRAMTAFNSREGGFLKTTVGRVQTPTLTMIVEREEKIQSFIPKAYFEIHGTFGCEAGQYVGIWFKPDFSKSAEDKDSKAQRIWSKEDAERILKECVEKTGTVTEESRKKTELSPLLFDLTSLQREANSRYGFPARRTLQIAQALYEKYKVLTYPRTDSRALPEDYLGEVRSIMQSLKETDFSDTSE
jgi:DNA topoisomerase-3